MNASTSFCFALTVIVVPTRADVAVSALPLLLHQENVFLG